MKTAAEWATLAAHNSTYCIDGPEEGEAVCDLCIQCAEVIEAAQADAFAAGAEAQREACAKCLKLAGYEPWGTLELLSGLPLVTLPKGEG